ncbi:MAG: SH3 domain-containing protein [Hyphomonadaceae bacterium]|nr:SH3 domain-containing protein [Hyphomonadaceae bacterium]
MVETHLREPFAAAQAIGAQVWSRAAPVARAAATFGSAANMAAAAVLGAGVFALALLASPVDRGVAGPTAEAAPGRAPAPAMRAAAPALASAQPVTAEGAAPGAAVETVLDYTVAFYWPDTPQTVAEPAAVRDGPTDFARVIHTARPGERLRINGRVDDAPGGPWLRVRLADGADGYFAARTVDVGAFRRRRAEEARMAAAAPDEALAAERGAPLALPPAIAEESEIGPPSF